MDIPTMTKKARKKGSLPGNFLSPGTAAVGGIAGIGIVIALWNRIKLYASKLYSILIVTIQIRSSVQLNNAFLMFLWKQFKCNRLGKKSYDGQNEFVRPLSRNQLVAFEEAPYETTLWWRGKKFLFVKRDGDGGATLSFPRFFFKRDELISEAVYLFNKSKDATDWKKEDRFFVRKMVGTLGKNLLGSNSVSSGDEPEVAEKTAKDEIYKQIMRPLQWTRDELGQPKRERAMDMLSLSQGLLDALKEALRWRNSEKWFKKRSVPWKKGWLVYGIPGTGKTAYVRALGQELNMPIFSFDLSTMSNQDFLEKWEKAKNWSPCITLFEDIDAIFKGRENVAAKGMNQGLSFDCFLNTLDGVENTDGMFIIVTTNDISTIDPAIGNPTNGDQFSTRPGRIDRHLKFEPLNAPGRDKMAKRILGDFDKQLWTHLLEEGNKDTGAQFQERCCRRALDLFWKDKKEVR